MNQEQYQNLLSQIHELNRQNLLNENEQIEQVSYKIDVLSQIINKPSKKPEPTNNNKTSDKFLIAILCILIINTILLIFIIVNDSRIAEQIASSKNNKQKIVEEIKQEVVEDDVKDDVLSFNKESIELFEDENFSEIKPLIRKSTPYTCKDDNKVYKIPYTVEIKGKLYSDKFMFILQEDSITKECAIRKENM